MSVFYRKDLTYMNEQCRDVVRIAKELGVYKFAERFAWTDVPKYPCHREIDFNAKVSAKICFHFYRNFLV